MLPVTAIMKRLTFEEFSHRVNEYNKAARIFAPLTKNIVDAFKIYQEVLAEEKMEVFLSTEILGNRPMTVMDDFERPQCPDCGTDMRFRIIPPNDDGILTQLVCGNDECDTVLDSNMSIFDWMKVLEKK